MSKDLYSGAPTLPRGNGSVPCPHLEAAFGFFGEDVCVSCTVGYAMVR